MPETAHSSVSVEWASASRTPQLVEGRLLRDYVLRVERHICATSCSGCNGIVLSERDGQ